MICEPLFVGDVLSALAMASIQVPAERIASGDSNTQAGIDGAVRVTYTSPDVRLKDRHSEGANFLFCDGHVKWQNRTRWVYDPDWIATK